MPSPNDSPANAIELAPLPNVFSTVIDAIFIAYWKYTAQPGDTGISLFIYNNTLGFANIVIYENETDANNFGPLYLGISSSAWVPIEFPVVPGTTYYIEVDSDGSSNVPVDFSVLLLPNDTVPAGSLVVPDSKQGFPVIFADSTSGTFLRLISPYADGETSVVLANGISLSEEFYGKTANIYDPQFNLIAAVAIPGWASGRLAAGTNSVDTFYVAGNSATVYTLDATGAFGGTTWTLAGTPNHIQPSPDDTILYWDDGSGAIQRHNLLTDTAMTDLVGAMGAPYLLDEFHVLLDGRIAALYQQFALGPAAVRIRIYNPDGSTSLTVDDTITLGHSGDRLALGQDDLTTVWLWIHPPTGNAESIFREIDTTTGAIVRTVSGIATFITGVYMGAESASPLAENGIPESCAFFISRVAIGPVPGCPGLASQPRIDGLPYVPPEL